MANTGTQYGAYKRVNVETASQGKLVVMMFNGAIQRAEEAKRLISNQGGLEQIHKNLIRAQEIISELRTSLDMSTGGIARDLDRIYEYFLHLLITGNIRKDPQPIAQCVTLMTEMRDTWQEAFDIAQREQPQAAKAPQLNQHGSAVMNLQG